MCTEEHSEKTSVVVMLLFTIPFIFSVIMGLVMQRRVQTAPNVVVDDDFNCSRSRNATTAL